MWLRNEGGSETDLGIRDEPDPSGFQGCQQDVRKEPIHEHDQAVFSQRKPSRNFLIPALLTTKVVQRARTRPKPKVKMKTLQTHSATLAPTK
jgi:hypothetical protein